MALRAYRNRPERMDAMIVSPSKFEVELPNLEAFESEEKGAGAAHSIVEYSYVAVMQKRPEPGVKLLYRFLIPHAGTPSSEQQLESRTLYVELQDAATKSQEAIEVKYRGSERGIEFLLGVLHYSARTPNYLAAEADPEESGLSWTITRARYPLDIYIKIRVALTDLQASAQQLFVCSEEATGVNDKVSLLEEASATGDLSLICKVKKMKPRLRLVA